YWLLDGYGRDWLHSLQQQSAQAAGGVATAAPVVALAPTAHINAPPQPASMQAARALPFTTPDMEQQIDPPDYLAPGTVAAPPLPKDQRPQRLLAPSIGIDTPVTEVFVQDGAWQVADYAAGYHHGSALPGEVGNTVMAGHAGLRGGVFRNL